MVVNSYSAKANKYLGKWNYFFNNVYDLEDLSKDEYLYLEEGNMWNGNKSFKLLMNVEAEEPFYRYTILKLEIIKETKNAEGEIVQDGESVIVEDRQVIDALIDLRSNGQLLEWDEKFDYFIGKGVFYFDLPCELTYSSVIYPDEDGTIYFCCYNSDSQQYQYFDATSILSEYIL